MLLPILLLTKITAPIPGVILIKMIKAHSLGGRKGVSPVSHISPLPLNHQNPASFHCIWSEVVHESL